MTNSSLPTPGKRASCRVESDAFNQWRRATWRSFVPPQQALQRMTVRLGRLTNPLTPLFFKRQQPGAQSVVNFPTGLRYGCESTHTLPCVAYVRQPGVSANIGDLDPGWTRNAGIGRQLFGTRRNGYTPVRRAEPAAGHPSPAFILSLFRRPRCPAAHSRQE
ncbi:hypothetical protein GCM10022408_18010 [Hymenobacter fastidiosus]|uniref:Uncharacterized protein n=1 Tax=Hymenobacter fastidiosus TaxID=486264 RepID=A0ABP7S4L3_9BACT